VFCRYSLVASSVWHRVLTLGLDTEGADAKQTVALAGKGYVGDIHTSDIRVLGRTIPT